MNHATPDPLQELRVLAVATTFPRWDGDSEPRFVFDLARHLSRRVQLWVLVPGAPGAAACEEIDGVRIIRFPYFFPASRQHLSYEGGILPKLKSSWLARAQLPFFLAAQLFHMGKWARRLEIDLIHCHWILPQGFFAALIHKCLGIPYILTALGADAFVFRNHVLFRSLRQFAVRNSLACTANSPALLAALRPLSLQTNYHYIPNGVDRERFNPDRKDPALRKQLGIEGPFLLGVGRFALKKGFQYLIQAMPAIISRHPRAKLVLVGFGPEESSLKLQAKQLELENQVIFPGGKSGLELATYFATADIFIGPSIVTASGDTEGQPAVFIEAMASRTAVVATPVGGITDMVRDGQTGLLVGENNPAAIADAVCTLLDSPDIKNRIEDEGYKWVRERFDWESIAESYLRLYRSAANRENR
ncbi:MAG: hypothetical protein COV67_09400 [Nitrospinae bacterium CG11_big_fil_rev_8_21_14_0_20_56_8]|nr:MAG: hypothetical protein COV67_09400 [Nitrospinae bacterium CG11_big_fil_rev_8_21_14_0_20_56_8]